MTGLGTLFEILPEFKKGAGSNRDNQVQIWEKRENTVFISMETQKIVLTFYPKASNFLPRKVPVKAKMYTLDSTFSVNI